MTKCKAITIKGTACSFAAIRGTDFCGHHRTQREKIKRFIQKHMDGINGFLSGALSDPIVSDFYDYIKEQLKFQYLVPPTIETPREDDIESLSIRFKNKRDGESLYKILPYLKTGMKFREISKLLGPDDETLLQNGHRVLPYKYVSWENEKGERIFEQPLSDSTYLCELWGRKVELMISYALHNSWELYWIFSLRFAVVIEEKVIDTSKGY